MTQGIILDHLLATKLLVPQERPELIHRQRLIDRLQEGLQYQLTLLSAPAGFGKTSLLSSWIHHNELGVAWLSLDETDNDPVQFLDYFHAALHKIDLSNIETHPTTTTAARFPLGRSALTTVINQASVSSNQFIIMLDDYHLITNTQIHEIMDFLLEHCPPQLHVFIATRADPPLSLARLRARNQLIEIREADLRFSHREAADFLRRSMGVEINFEQASDLADKTEGWIAGLQLAAISIRDEDARSDFISTFSGNNAFIADYLTQEILFNQPEDRRQFLLKSSILDRLTGPLCAAVTGLTESQAILEEFRGANLFLIPLDDQRVWYRYHRLFADLLKKHLTQSDPELEPDLHSRASLWYEKHGFPGEAIHHALLAEDFNRAGDLVNLNAERTLALSQITTFLGWLHALPDDVIQERSNLYIYQTLVLMISGSRITDIDVRLDNLEQAGEGLAAGKVLLDAYLAAHKGQTGRVSKLALAAYNQLAENEGYLRIFATWLYGLSLFNKGDQENAHKTFNEVLQLCRKTGNVMIGVSTLSYLAMLRIRQGKLDEAESIYQQALNMASDKQGNYLPIAGEALIGLGILKLETYQLEEAEKTILAGIELVHDWSEIAVCKGYLQLAQLHQTRGNHKAANQALKKAEQLALQSETTEIDDLQVNMQRAKLAVDQRKLNLAKQLTANWILDEKPVSTQSELPMTIEDHLRKYRLIILARLSIADQNYDQAFAYLNTARREVERLQRIDLILEIKILSAIAFHNTGNQSDATEAIESALNIGGPAGFVRLFVDAGETMAQLLYHALSLGIHAEFAGKLLALIPSSTPSDHVEEKPEFIVEPLTKREVEVLQCIAEGQSNRLIAQSLSISLNTVKGHNQRIFSKLNVNNRTQAVAKAKLLNILD